MRPIRAQRRPLPIVLMSALAAWNSWSVVGTANSLMVRSCDIEFRCRDRVGNFGPEGKAGRALLLNPRNPGCGATAHGRKPERPAVLITRRLVPAPPAVEEPAGRETVAV